MIVPQMPLAEARRSLGFHVENVLPMPADEAVLDFYPTSWDVVDSRPVMNGMLVAVSTAMVTQVLGATDKAGLDLKAIDLSAFAIYRALSDGATDSKTVAFIDLGARVTTVAVYSHGTPRVIRHLDGGTLSVADGISSSLGISFEDAYNALHGTVATGLTNDAVSAIRAQTDALFDGIRQTIQYYSSSSNAEPIAEIVLTGGGCLRAQPSSGARKRFAPARLPRRREVAHHDGAQDRPSQIRHLAIALRRGDRPDLEGDAMSALPANVGAPALPQVSLIPPEFARRSRQTQLRAVSLIIVLAAFGLTIGWWFFAVGVKTVAENALREEQDRGERN